MKYRFVIVLIGLSFSCAGQVYPLEDFIETPLPGSINTSPLLFDNYSEFLVSIASGKLQVSKFMYKEPGYISLPNGHIHVFRFYTEDRLYYKPSDSTKRYIYVNTVPVSPDTNSFRNDQRRNRRNNRTKGYFPVNFGSKNRMTIFPFKDSLYLMNTFPNYQRPFGGAIYNLQVKNDFFTVSKEIDFEDQPMILQVHGDSILVASSSHFYILNYWKKEAVFEKIMWGDILHPNSIAILDEKNIFVGMLGGYAKIDAIEKTIKFYGYKKIEFCK